MLYQERQGEFAREVELIYTPQSEGWAMQRAAEYRAIGMKPTLMTQDEFLERQRRKSADRKARFVAAAMIASV